MSEQQPTKEIVVVTDESGFEAMYVNGDLVQSDETIFASDIAWYAGPGAVVLRHESIEFVHGDENTIGWPKRLEDALK